MFTASKEDNMTNLKSTSREYEAAGDVVLDAKEELSHAANRAGKKVRKLLHSASDEMEHVKDTVKDQIRTNPLQSGLIALGIGVVLGALIRR